MNAIVYLALRISFKQLLHVFARTSYEASVSGNYTSLGGGLFLLTGSKTFSLIPVYAYSILFVYLPPDSTFGLRQCRLPLSEAPREVDFVLTEDQAVQFPDVFCLETSAWLFEFSYWVYYDPPNVTTKSSYGPIDVSVPAALGFDIYRFISDEESDTHLLIGRKGSRIVMSFRGTSSWENVKTDLLMSTTPIPHRPREMEVFLAPPKVHTGFWRVFSTIKKRMMEAVKDILNSNTQPQFFLTGHSLGKKELSKVTPKEEHWQSSQPLN